MASFDSEACFFRCFRSCRIWSTELAALSLGALLAMCSVSILTISSAGRGSDVCRSFSVGHCAEALVIWY